MVCVNAGRRNYGFVGLVQNRLSCLSCQYDTHNCIHLQYINKCIQSSEPNLPDVVYIMVEKSCNLQSQQSEQHTGAYGPTCHSKTPIQFTVPPHLQILFTVTLESSTLLSDGGHVMVTPLPDQNGKCPVCSSPWDLQDPIAMNWTKTKAVAFTMKTMFKCKGIIIILHNHVIIS